MNEVKLDIAANRKAMKYSRVILLRRVLWGLVYPLFRFSPRICFGWRRILLRAFGAGIDEQVNIYNSVEIFMPWNLEVGAWSSIGERAYIYNPGKITIGTKSTISQRAHLCAASHDYRKSDLPILIQPITVGDQVWICADAFVGPNVTIGDGAIVGARGAAFSNVKPWDIVAGNPARVVGKRVLEDPK